MYFTKLENYSFHRFYQIKTVFSIDTFADIFQKNN